MIACERSFAFLEVLGSHHGHAQGGQEKNQGAQGQGRPCQKRSRAFSAALTLQTYLPRCCALTLPLHFLDSMRHTDVPANVAPAEIEEAS